MRRYSLSNHVFVEIFDDDAVLLVADREVMISVNHAAAQLFEDACVAVGKKQFDRADCVNFLFENFELDRTKAEQQVRSILGFALRQGIVLRKQ